MKKIQLARFITQSVFLSITIAALFSDTPWLGYGFIAMAILAGSVYCGWACPFGFLQDLSARLGRLLGIRKRPMPASLHNTAVYFRYLLTALVLWAASDPLLTLLSAEPRGAFLGLLNSQIAGTAALIAIGITLLLSMVYERFYCRYLCIEGARYGAMSIFRPFSIRRSTATCVNCKKCDRACPMQIQVSKTTHLHSPQCINCMNCVSACPAKDALTFGTPLKQATPQVQSEPMPARTRRGA